MWGSRRYVPGRGRSDHRLERDRRQPETEPGDPTRGGVTVSVDSRHRLSAFGLTVDSAFDIPELPESESPGGADVVVTRRAVDRPADAEDDRSAYRNGPDEQLLLYEAATISIRDGREIAVDPDPAVPEEVIRHVIIGPAFNYLLHQRGYFVLHASTVEIGDAAVAFVGESGMGKTTTATAFLCAGHRVLSDDVAAIELGAEGPRVRSGYPSIKLDPTVVDRLDVPVEEPRRTSRARDRHFHGLRHQQPESPVPLERIYLLADGPAPAVLPIEPQERIFELVRNTYTIPLIEASGKAESNFSRCTALAGSVQVRRLRRKRDLEKLPELVELVEEDVDADTE
jgi:hypothetical protein